MNTETVESLRAKLRARLKQIPRALAIGGSVQAARSFKAFVGKAQKTADSPRATTQQLSSLINEYNSFT